MAVQSRARAESLYLQCFWCKKNWRTTTWSFCFSMSGTWFRTMPTRLTSCMICDHVDSYRKRTAKVRGVLPSSGVLPIPLHISVKKLPENHGLTRSPTDGIPALPTGSHCCGLSWGSDAARFFGVLERGRTMSFYAFWGRVIAVVERIEQCRAQASQTILSCYIIFIST